LGYPSVVVFRGTKFLGSFVAPVCMTKRRETERDKKREIEKDRKRERERERTSNRSRETEQESK
jgi:hypothetical protein